MLLDALYCNVDHRFLLSFPTRRSSDLYAWAQARYPHLPAKAQAVKAILDGAKLGFEQGLPNERSIFLELVQSPQSVALRYVFGAERAAARIPGLERDTAVRTVNRVGIYGRGQMANDLARDFNAARSEERRVGKVERALVGWSQV